MKWLINFLYTLVIGAAVTTFIGLGSYAFYPAPDYDQSCYELNRPASAASGVEYDYMPADNEAVQSCKDERKAEQQEHAATTAIIGLVATALLIGMTMKPFLKVEEVSDGVAAGGIFTSVYTVIWAANADHRVLLFLSGTAFLVSALVTGTVKFKEKA